MNKVFLFGVLFVIFSAGCVNIEFYQKISVDGSSTLAQKVDLSASMASLPPEYASNMSTTLEEKCKNMKALGVECTVDGLKYTVRKSFTTQDGFYTFETSNGIFGSKYKVRVIRIPSKTFAEASSAMAEQPATQQEDLILADTVKNAQNALALQMMKANITYVVEMPAPITSATAGKYSAKIDGNRATFDFLKVMENSEPLVIEAEAGSGWMLIAVGAAALAVILIVIFFMFGRKQQPA